MVFGENLLKYLLKKIRKTQLLSELFSSEDEKEKKEGIRDECDDKEQKHNRYDCRQSVKTSDYVCNSLINR